MSFNQFSSTLIGSDLLIPVLDDDDDDDRWCSSILSQRRLSQQQQTESQRQLASQLQVFIDDTTGHDTTFIDLDFDDDDLSRSSHSSSQSAKSFAEELEERAEIEREFNEKFGHLSQSVVDQEVSLEGRQVIHQLNSNSRSPTPVFPKLTQEQFEECNISSFLRVNAAREAEMEMERKAQAAIAAQAPKKSCVRNLDLNGYDDSDDDSMTDSQKSNVERMLASIADEPVDKPIIEYSVLSDSQENSQLEEALNSSGSSEFEDAIPSQVPPMQARDQIASQRPPASIKEEYSDEGLDTEFWDNIKKLEQEHMQEMQMLESIAEEPFEQPVIKEFSLLSHTLSPEKHSSPEREVNELPSSPLASQSRKAPSPTPMDVSEAGVAQTDSDDWYPDTQTLEEAKRLEEEYFANERLAQENSTTNPEEASNQDLIAAVERAEKSNRLSQEHLEDIQQFKQDFVTANREPSPEIPEFPLSQLQLSNEEQQEVNRLLASVERAEKSDRLSQENHEDIRQFEHDYLTANREPTPEIPEFPLSQLQLSIEEQQEVDRMLALVEQEPEGYWDNAKPVDLSMPEIEKLPSVEEVMQDINQKRDERKKLNKSLPVRRIKNVYTSLNSKLNRRLNKMAQGSLKRNPSESDADYEYRVSQRIAFLENYNFSQVEHPDLDYTLIAPPGTYKPPEIPEDAPKKFVSAKTFNEASQSQKKVPLSEKIEKNEIVVNLEREHDIEQEIPEEVVDDVPVEVPFAEDNAEKLDESLQELSDRIDLNISLTSLSQKLNSSDVLEHCVKNKPPLEMSTQQCEEMFLHDIPTQKDTQEPQNQQPAHDSDKHKPPAEMSTQQCEDMFLNEIKTQRETQGSQLSSRIMNYQRPKLNLQEQSLQQTEMQLANFNALLLNKAKNQEPKKTTTNYQTIVKRYSQSPAGANSVLKITQSPAHPSESGKKPNNIGNSMQKKNVAQSSTSAFKMASGKKFAVSHEALKNAEKLDSQSPAHPSASGKKVHFTPNNVENAIKMKNAAQSSTSAFKMASGKKLAVSDEALKNAEKLDSQSPASKPDRNVEVTPNNLVNGKKKFDDSRRPQTGGFKMASGKQARDDTPRSNFNTGQSESIDDGEISPKQPVQKALGGFGFASGKSLGISAASTAIAKRNFLKSSPPPIKRKQLFTSDDSDDDEAPPAKKVAKQSFGGFGLASGKNLAISDTSKANAKRKFNEIDTSSDSPKQGSPKRPKIAPSFSSFRRGNSAKQEVDDKSQKSQSYSSFRVNKRSKPTEDDLFDFSTTRSDKSQNSTASSSTSTPANKKYKTIDDPFTMDSKPKTVDTPNTSKVPMSPFEPSHASSPVVDIKRARSSLLRLDSKKKSPTSTPKSKAVVIRGDPNQISSSTPSPKPKAVVIRGDPNQVYSPAPTAPKSKAVVIRGEISDSQVLSKNHIMTRYKNGTKVVNNWPELMPPELMVVAKTRSEEDRQWDILMNLDRYVHPLEIQAARELEKECEIKFAMREEKMAAQLEYIKNKPHEDTLPIRGSLYIMRQNQDQEEMPAPSIYEFDRRDVPSYTRVDIKKLLEMAFSVKELIPEGDPEISITLGDSAEIVIGDLEHVEYENIKLAFLSSLGVDPKLLHEKWIENAFMMIVINLYLKEQKSLNGEKFLTAENILLELKYRYDREIDLSEMCAIRSITEQDGQPNARMILMVIAITFNPDIGYELELSDGWYKIRTKIDTEMSNAIDRGAVTKFSKLMISHAVYHNVSNQPNHPFDISASNKLEIFTNSTRLVSDDAKLGFCEDKRPFQVRLDSVVYQGGRIGKLRLFITHTYGINYRVRSDNDKFYWRSERMQNRYMQKRYAELEKAYEKLLNEAVKEYRSGLSESAKEFRKKLRTEYTDIEEIPISDLVDFLDYEYEDTEDRVLVWSNMTKYQRGRYEVHISELSAKMHKNVQEEVEKLEPKVSKIIRFHAVDLDNPEKSALISYQNPSDDIIEMIKEGRMIELSGATCYTSAHQLSLSAYDAHCEEIKNFIPDLEIFSQFYRQESKFSVFKEFMDNKDLFHQEVDIVCMVVHISDKDTDIKKQWIYVVDEHKNFLKIQFEPDIAEFAYDKVIEEQDIFYIRNLQWSRYVNKDNPKTIVTYVSPETVFTRDRAKDRLEKFKNAVGEKYHEKCLKMLYDIDPMVKPLSMWKLKTKLEDNQDLVIKYGYTGRYLGKPCEPRRYRFKV